MCVSLYLVNRSTGVKTVAGGIELKTPKNRLQILAIFVIFLCQKSPVCNYIPTQQPNKQLIRLER